VGLLERIADARGEQRFGIDQYITDYIIPTAFTYNGNTYPLHGLTQTYAETRIQRVSSTLPGYAAALRACPPAFAAQMVRALVLSQARFTWRNRPWSATPRRTFGTAELGVLERPWPKATTGDLLSTMEWHAGLAGNSFVTRQPNRLRVLRPDWCGLVWGSESEPEYAPTAIDAELVGLVYQNGGLWSGQGEMKSLLPDEFAHWAPIPDPEFPGMGQSWVTAALSDIQSDRAATEHKFRFFTNGATPNMVVKGIPAATKPQFDEIVDAMEARHAGVANAYRTLYLTAGADATVVGSDLRQLDFKATQGAGEPLALDTPIPTPTGWTTMGEIQVGDQVIGRDGRPANVLGVSPVHVDRDCFRVTLKDGTSIVADASHIWAAIDRGSAKRREKTYTTRELFELHHRGYPNGAGGYRVALPAAPVVELPAADLLVDPYVLGAWLGDGQTAGAAVCGATEDLKFIAHEIEARGYTTTRWATAEDKVDVIGVPGGLLHALRALGVLGDKHIPAAYLRASAQQRLDLLRGLMDTDGTIGDGRGGCEYSSKDERLARQVVELIRSLGYRVSIKARRDARSRTGLQWRVHFRVAMDRIPFLLPRKVDRALASGDPHYSDQRSVVSIEPVESVPVRCVAVDTEDHLFLAGDGFVPTHNTRIAMLGRVPAPLLGISEGLAGSSLNAGNFGMARRIFADSWIYPSLQNVAASLEPLLTPPTRRRNGLSDAELWFDTADMPLLREDAKDAAEIENLKAETITKLVREGFTPDSAIAAVQGQDMNQLKHTGYVSVQLQLPGATPSPNPKPPALPAGKGS
jgi:portal protein/LAGLIDADG DNA endonuclease family protein